MKAIFMIGCFLALSGCTTTEYVVKEVETEITPKGYVNGKTLGLNDDDEVILQEQTRADDELRIQQHVNESLLSDLSYEHHQLKRCREDLADPRLGGNGELEFSDLDDMKSPVEVQEQFGITEDEALVFVRRSKFMDQLKSERRYETTLRKMTRIVKKDRERCDRKMGYVRVKHGLPAKRYQGDGYFTGSGTWVQTKMHEHSLDDAFAIQQRGHRGK